MKKLQILKKVAELGRNAAENAGKDSSLYLLFQPKEPEIMKKIRIIEEEMTEKN